MLRATMSVFIVLAFVVGAVFGNALTGLTGGNMMQSYCRSGSYRPNAGDLLPVGGNAPYVLKIVTKVNQYRPGQTIEATLEGVGGKRFKGFFITNDCVEKQIMIDAGTFTPKNSQFAKVSQFCGDDGLTHTGTGDKSSVSFYWTPPAKFSLGRCQFKATVIENNTVFYTGVLSPSIASDPTMPSYSMLQQQIQQRLQNAIQTQNQAEIASVMNEMKAMAPNSAHARIGSMMNLFQGGNGGAPGIPGFAMG